ncbi:MAG TPA: aldo/keto reductase [Thermoanaerobaculia bacterium]|jgi:diketogulonate reductase-like aldo/keto reductase
MHHRPIPSSGEVLPIIGLGTWQTFDVEGAARAKLVPVVERFAAGGGRVIDTSPMYGRAEEAVGELKPANAFLATKVWTEGRGEGITQMERSMRLLRTNRIDLMQVHNLVDWRTHLATLRRWKDEGRVRYIGITHYRTGAFPELERIMRSETIDFVQLPYSVGVPDAEERLLPLAEERGIAVLVNRPFEEGALTRRRPAESLLRWIVSHPAVTCVIPATRNPLHLAENLRAGEGPLPDAKERARLRAQLLSA